LATRGAGDEKLIDGILKFDELRRKALSEVETLKATRNRVSKEIGALMGQKNSRRQRRRKRRRANWAIASSRWTTKRSGLKQYAPS